MRPISLFTFLPTCATGGVAQSGTGQDKRSENQPIGISLQKRIAIDATEKDFKIIKETPQWLPSQMAIIICDMWDTHWCHDATARVGELAPKINEVIGIAREMGVLIVHSPSDCMDYYRDYPERKLALRYKEAGVSKLLNLLSTEKLPSEEKAIWPVDQSDGGCSDVPPSIAHRAWTKQNDQIDIKPEDAISDAGDEIAGLFSARGIRNVILTGVHTNMCIIERTFGLRNMVRLGMQVVLMRDLTDLMYDSKMWPYVSHFSGLRLMIEYIEKYIAPTALSSDFTHGSSFVFSQDKPGQPKGKE